MLVLVVYCWRIQCLKAFSGNKRAKPICSIFQLQIDISCIGWFCTYGGIVIILGDPGAASRDDGIFMGESLQQERESPWALTLTERVPEAFEIPPSDWPEKFFSGQSAKRNSRATLMSSYTRLFSSSNAVVAWPVQREHFWGELQKK